MNALNIHRVNSLPATLEASSIYYVSNVVNPELVEIYMTGNNPETVKRTVNRADVDAWINLALADIELSSVLIVATIAERDALVLDRSTLVLVIDATGDSSVKTGAATYVYNASAQSFTKISEFESLDLVLSWDGITDGPESTPEQIDQSVLQAHAHANSGQLAKVDQDAQGEFTYNGQYPLARISTEEW